MAILSAFLPVIGILQILRGRAAQRVSGTLRIAVGLPQATRVMVLQRGLWVERQFGIVMSCRNSRALQPAFHNLTCTQAVAFLQGS